MRVRRLVAVTGLLLLGMSPDASAQNPCAPSSTGNTTTFTHSTRTIVNAATKTEQVATFLTRLTARLDGGALVYDQSFPAAFSDPTVQAALTQARQAVTTAAAPATPTLTGPTRLTTATTTDTAVKTVDVLDPSVSPNPDVKVTLTIGPQTIMTGVEQSVVCTVAPGGSNIDTLITTTLARTVTTTTTTLTTEHWQLEGTTTPATVYTQYLAEGATSAFFDTQLALLNPGTVATTATLTFTPANAPLVVSTVAVPAHTRVTVNPKTIAGLAVAEFSTKVESAQRLVVDRTMTWDATGYGAHAETSVAAPAPTWYLAEGATHSGFDLFYLIQNPHPTDAAEVRVRYLRPSGAPLEKVHVVPAHSRATIWVDYEQIPAASGRTPLAEHRRLRGAREPQRRRDHRRARHVPRVARAGLRRRAREHRRHRPRPAVVSRRGRDRPLLRPLRARREPRPRGRGGRSDLPPAGGHDRGEALPRRGQQPLHHLGGLRGRPARRHGRVHHDSVHQRRAGDRGTRDVVARGAGHVVRGPQLGRRYGDRHAVGAGRGRSRRRARHRDLPPDCQHLSRRPAPRR